MKQECLPLGGVLSENGTLIATSKIAPNESFIHLKKVGRIVTMAGRLSTTSEISPNTNLYTIPAGYRPSESFIGVPFSLSGTYNAGTLWVFGNGNIDLSNLSNAIPAYKVCDFNATWITS